MLSKPTPFPVLLSPESAATDALGGPSADVEPPQPPTGTVDARRDNQGGTRVRP